MAFEAHSTIQVRRTRATLRRSALNHRLAFSTSASSASLSGLAERNHEMGTNAGMEGGAEPVHHIMGRSDSSGGARMHPVPLRPADFRCGRLQPLSRLTMNSLRSALTALFAGLKIHKSGRSGTTKELARGRATTSGTTITQNLGHYLPRR